MHHQAPPVIFHYSALSARRPALTAGRNYFNRRAGAVAGTYMTGPDRSYMSASAAGPGAELVELAGRAGGVVIEYADQHGVIVDPLGDGHRRGDHGPGRVGRVADQGAGEHPTARGQAQVQVGELAQHRTAEPGHVPAQGGVAGPVPRARRPRSIDRARPGRSAALGRSEPPGTQAATSVAARVGDQRGELRRPGRRGPRPRPAPSPPGPRRPAAAKSVLLTTSRSERVTPGPPWRGTSSPPATSMTKISTVHQPIGRRWRSGCRPRSRPGPAPTCTLPTASADADRAGTAPRPGRALGW